MDVMRLGFIDVVRAYFHARARRDMYLELLREGHEEGMCGKLGKALYGTRDAAQTWDMEYTEMTTEAKFKQGAYSSCVFSHGERNIRAAVHGDDFTVLGRSGDLDWFRKVIDKRVEVKYEERLSRDREGAVRVLNRVAISTKEGIEYEADQRHAEIIVRDKGLKEHSKGVTMPGVNHDGGAVDEVEVNDTLYRAIAARANHLA